MGSRTKTKKYSVEVSQSDVFSLVKYTKRTRNIADKALNNIIIPFPNFDPTVFDDNFWYVDKTKKYGASYQLYIQSLRVCAELLNEYEKTEDPRYLNKTQEIIESWIKYEEGKPSEKMLWYDHPTANRIQTIIHFLYHAKQQGLSIQEDKYYRIMQRHAEVLSDDKNYNNNNHGLMMDRSLMILGNVLDDKYLFTKGFYRAIDTFWFSFSHQGIHLENSPEYHNMVVSMYEGIEEYLNEKGKTLGKNVTGYLKLAKDYPNALLKPDGRMPSIGDSGKGIVRKNKVYKNIYDVEAGIAVLQNKDPKPFYVSFVCGYSSAVHKHKDDLSITTNYNGKEFFVDPGKFNYSKSKERTYVVSKAAHSSFHLKDFNYVIDPKNRFERKTVLNAYEDNKFYSIVKGKHTGYTGTSAVLYRTLIVFKHAPVLIVLDELETDIEHELNVVQKFNLHQDVEIAENEHGYRLTHGEESLTVKQFNEINAQTVIDGNEEDKLVINTASFGKGINTRQLDFSKSLTSGTAFTTAVYDEETVESLNIEVKEESVEIVLDNQKYTVLK
nr:heparinase II/III family protein [Salinicoccus sp. RF5]